ncbi:MAG: ABC transporter ATP-binding protein [Myxococcales bacterium]|nr:ABC transporter ATP-binding protein [Myxococcales bacterium]
MSRWRASLQARFGDFELDVELAGDDGPLVVIGPNGSGKTTLLRVLAGALEPTRAEIEVGDRVLYSSRRGARVPIEERRVGYVPQGYGLFPHLSALDNVAFGLSMGARRLPRAEARRRARRLLDELGCGELAVRTPAGLSGGERQRVALARALVIEPELLLLDEPLTALDVRARRAVRGFLADRLRALGRPSILVTHDVRDIATLGVQVCVLERGRVVQRGALAQLRAAPASEFVAEFVGSLPALPSGEVAAGHGGADDVTARGSRVLEAR